MTALAYAWTAVAAVLWALAFVGAVCLIGELLWRVTGWFVERPSRRDRPWL